MSRTPEEWKRYKDKARARLRRAIEQAWMEFLIKNPEAGQQGHVEELHDAFTSGFLAGGMDQLDRIAKAEGRAG